MYLILGMVEMGIYFKSYLAVTAATSDGARTASIVGADSAADFTIMQAVKKTLTAVPESQIRNLTVWSPSAPSSCSGGCNPANPVNATPPAACTSAVAARVNSTTSVCNAYTPTSDWANTDSTKYGCIAPNNWSVGYCPTTRKTAASSLSPNGPPSFIGITISIDHQYVTKLFGSTKTIVYTVITQLEPESLQ